ncbi:hypothetical protein RHGRI_034140 [Rhododendron griersonianum]|uniref:Methyltransferase type 11 domain-containing protein n=1 Tax=Rhododendron griersonianum TaxID=479676 RepID=A0AAV6HZG2_9ERIC|nr:hypothetical protein RHGRI_034140 [Rhododendron griersonianum]KAG5521813.1 hypothetical protein RHGRI_034140 [Rhododendron griersonianum]
MHPPSAPPALRVRSPPRSPENWRRHRQKIGDDIARRVRHSCLDGCGFLRERFCKILKESGWGGKEGEKEGEKDGDDAANIFRIDSDFALCVAESVGFYVFLPLRKNTGMLWTRNGLECCCLGDAAISIAVLHHLSTESRRKKAIDELIRVVKNGGLVLITVWAVEQEDRLLVNEWTPLTDKLVSNMSNAVVVDRFYDKSNWCIVLVKTI